MYFIDLSLCLKLKNVKIIIINIMTKMLAVGKPQYTPNLHLSIPYYTGSSLYDAA
jgi:hypothetical protein